MVAQDDLRRARLDEVLHQRHDRDAVGPTVDEIAHEDDRAIYPAALGVTPEAEQERAKRVDLAVHVADDVDAVGEKRSDEGPTHGAPALVASLHGGFSQPAQRVPAVDLGLAGEEPEPPPEHETDALGQGKRQEGRHRQRPRGTVGRSGHHVVERSACHRLYR